jgi:hypothetical protein
MRLKTLRSEKVVFRNLPSGATYALTLARRPRAFVLSGHGNVAFATGTVGDRWLEVDLAEATNAIIASGWYTRDVRHPLIVQLYNTALRGLVGQRVQTKFGTAGTVESVARGEAGYRAFYIRSEAGGTWVAGVLHNVPMESVVGF